MAKASIIVELDRKEVQDAIEEKAKLMVGKAGGIGGVKINPIFTGDDEDAEFMGAEVTFTWAKPNL